MSDQPPTLVPRVGPDDHAQGPDDAAITLVEYGDYQCPYCGQAYPVVKELQRRFDGSLRFVFRNMPLANIHERANDAAQLAEAAAPQGYFWPMHDMMYEHQKDLSEQSLLGYAREVGADVQAVRDALTSGTPQRRVESDVESGLRSGVNGTPTFFVNGIRYEGSWQVEPFARYLESVIAP